MTAVARSARQEAMLGRAQEIVKDAAKSRSEEAFLALLDDLGFGAYASYNEFGRLVIPGITPVEIVMLAAGITYQGAATPQFTS